MSNGPKRRSGFPNVNGNHEMTWKELAEADDLASSLTVDAFLQFTTHKMNPNQLRISGRLKSKLREAVLAFKQHKCYETAYEQLTTDANIVKRAWKLDPRFRTHVYRYLLLFDERSGVEIRPCSRYASENHVGAAIYATKDWPKGTRIHTLIGCIAEMNLSEERSFLKFRENDFSVMYSSRKNCSQLWLGPAAYVNHDCQPNCEFTINCDADARMSLESKRDIRKGDEIYIYYGKHFFDVNNNSCECFTCELLGRGYFNKSCLPNGQILSNNESLHSPTGMVYPNCGGVALSRSESGFSNAINFPNPTAAKCSGKSVQNSSDQPGNLSLTLLHSPNGSLKKGSSAGLLNRALPNAYSLRRTGFRMDRIKSRISAALSASRTSMREDNPTATTSESIDCLLDNGSSTRIPRRRRTLNSFSTPSVLSLRSRLSTKSASEETSPVLENMSLFPFNSHDFATNSIVPSSSPPLYSSSTTSPAPPQLDRVSSIETTSMPSQLSTAAVTPEPSDADYFNISCQDSLFSHVLMPCLQPGCVTGDHDSAPTSHHTSATSPACETDPILTRLLDETKMNSTKPSLRRLTNYDARLIAETKIISTSRTRPRRHTLTHSTSSVRDIAEIGNSLSPKRPTRSRWHSDRLILTGHRLITNLRRSRVTKPLSGSKTIVTDRPLNIDIPPTENVPPAQSDDDSPGSGPPRILPMVGVVIGIPPPPTSVSNESDQSDSSSATTPLCFQHDNTNRELNISPPDMNYIYTEHDYTKPIIHRNYSRLKPPCLNSFDESTSHSPPTIDSYPLDTPPHLYPNTPPNSDIASPSRTVPYCSVSNQLNHLPKTSDWSKSIGILNRNRVSLNQGLTLKFKRIGPHNYQISRSTHIVTT